MKQILIVDDDPGILEAFQFIFDPEKIEVIVQTDGSAILNEESLVPDLYILDKQLPGADGLAVCQFLKAGTLTSHVPVVLLSATPNIHNLAKIAGADASLEKPFAITALREIVQQFIGD